MTEEFPKGSRIGGRYRVERRLGEGGMGEVLACYDESLERDVALKVILPRRRGRGMSAERFIREAKVAARLRHSGAVDIYDFGEDGEVLYLVMEKLSGPALRDFVDVGLPLLPMEQAIGYALELAEVLAAAAKIGLVHRDLKPENVMLDDDGSRSRLVIVDFGLAHDLEEAGSTSRMTREGVITGTPDYLSPEQARGERCTPASDVYSLGCVLFEMLTGETPFGEGLAPTLLTRHLYMEPPTLRATAPGRPFPGALEDLVARMMSKEPEERPTAHAVCRALEALDLSAPIRFSGRAESGSRAGRRGRMNSVRATQQLEATEAKTALQGTSPEDRRVAWRGEPSQEVHEALEVGGIGVVAEGEEAPLLVVPGATVEEVRALAEGDVAVVTDADSADLQRLQALIQAGVSEVLIADKGASDWARTIARALRKRARTKR